MRASYEEAIRCRMCGVSKPLPCSLTNASITLYFNSASVKKEFFKSQCHLQKEKGDASKFKDLRDRNQCNA